MAGLLLYVRVEATGQQVAVEVPSSATARDVAGALREQGIELGSRRLCFGRTALAPDDALCDAGVGAESRLVVPGSTYHEWESLGGVEGASQPVPQTAQIEWDNYGLLRSTARCGSGRMVFAVQMVDNIQDGYHYIGAIESDRDTSAWFRDGGRQGRLKDPLYGVRGALVHNGDGLHVRGGVSALVIDRDAGTLALWHSDCSKPYYEFGIPPDYGALTPVLQTYGAVVVRLMTEEEIQSHRQLGRHLFPTSDPRASAGPTG